MRVAGRLYRSQRNAMYPPSRAQWSAPPAIAAAAVALIIVTAACDTQPATEVQPTAATLNGKGFCKEGLKGWWRYQLRDASAGGAFKGVGPQHDFNCSADTGEWPLESHRADGLTPGHRYEFRIRTDPVGRDPFTQDSNATVDGSDYDRFRTPTRSDWAVHCNQSPGASGCEGTGDVNSGGSEGTDSTECENGASVCASAAQMRCKGKRGSPLVNVHKRLHYWLEMWGANSRHSWCWKNGKILREHLSKDGDCWVTDYGATLLHYAHSCEYKYAECAPDLNSCLYRYEAKFSCCAPVSQVIPPRITFTRCLGTRVCAYACAPDGSGAYHSRVVNGGGCVE
jgi:hypothetical protein